MKHFLIGVVPALVFAFNVYAQPDQLIRHKVSKSETVTQIAKRYSVTPYDIFRLNPDSQAGIREDQVLLIPSSVQGNSTAASGQSAQVSTHQVQPKETLFSIARQYNVSVQELQNLNAAALTNGLKSGQTIKIPSQSRSQPTASSDREPTTIVAAPAPVTYHVVEPGQTKFSIAKKYGMTVQELERKNPAVANGLPAGYKLVIGTNKAAASDPITDVSKPIWQNEKLTTTVNRIVYANYEVRPKETLYSLSQMFNISTAELIALNPPLQNGVKIGMILKVPGKGSLVVDTGKGYKDLVTSINNTSRKELVMLLPFNADRIQGDSLRSVAERLKKDQFLNMTLDFYSGALMAIDSARALGMNVNIRILDSKESKNSSGVAALLKSNNFKNADAIIGPFYQHHLETAAAQLVQDSIPIISPLSKETGEIFPNLYQAMPSENDLKSALFDYMMSKNGNIIIVSDPKRQANRDFITKTYPLARFAKLSETGGFVPANLKALLVKDKLNYIVLDSEKTGMILATTNLLLNEMANYQLQLAIMEQNETLDFEEISMKRLTILKMLYPSVTRDNQSAAATAFAASYKEKNRIFPNQYATRGFDVTFDTLLRISQGKTFEDCIRQDKTEQIESRFVYVKEPDGAYVNKGIYILQYNDDLSVTEAQ